MNDRYFDETWQRVVSWEDAYYVVSTIYSGEDDWGYGPAFYRRRAEEIGRTANVRTVKAAQPAELSSLVDGVLKQRNPVLILFDEGLDVLHSAVLDEFQKTRAPGDHVMLFRGEGVTTRDLFYDECRRVMPGIPYDFRGGLDALDEILNDPELGLSPNPVKWTYWIWRNTHVLFTSDRESFWKLFTTLLDDARTISAGDRWRPRGQPVAVVLTGLWNELGAHASKGSSFLNTMQHWQYKPPPADEPTDLVTFHVSS